MRRSRKFCQRGSNFDNFFLIADERRKDPKTTIIKRAIICPPAKRHLNGVLLACRCWPNIECWLGSFVIFQGVCTSIAKKPYIFLIFQGRGGEGGGSDHLSPLWIRACSYFSILDGDVFHPPPVWWWVLCSSLFCGVVLGIFSSFSNYPVEKERAGCVTIIILWLYVYCVSSLRCHGRIQRG